MPGSDQGQLATNAIYVPPASSSGRQNASAKAVAKDPVFYLPMGSILSGTLLTGLDAPATGSNGRKDPFPSLLRIKHEAILPNSALLDLRECLLIASSYGDLSSERVYMRAEGLSCVRGDGAVLEVTIDAYASGSDGKAGIRGLVVEKTGQLVARSLMAGMVSGFATAFKPVASQPITVNPGVGQNQGFQFPDPSYVAGTAALNGVSEAASRVATIYEDLAKQIFPVISVSAGAPVDFVLTRGSALRFKVVGDLTGNRTVTASPTQRPTDGPATTSLSGSYGGSGLQVQQGPGTSNAPPVPGGPSSVFNSRPR
jgi:conjugal transfer pilus assembly protein TraB